MRFSTRNAAPLVVLVLGVIALALLFVDSGEAQGPPPVRPEYELTAQILSRVDNRGRMELCLRTEDGQVICPEARFLRPDLVSTDRWISSSDAFWEVPIDPARVTYLASEPPVRPDDSGCNFDAERMLSATWKVETTRSFGTAFHIGGGRFVTAHHVIERRPPFVSLIHGERTISAVVIGSDPLFDLALLEVVTPELVSDVPTVRLRAPRQQDVGQPVFVVGYPGGEALTFSGGGIVTQVWDDSIQTNSATRGGNSGGPVFDACGDVIGVVWAGSSSWAYTNSGRALLTSLRRINEQWPGAPRLPEWLPTTLRAADRLIWHYGPQPPQEVDCSEVDGDWWIGVAGIADEEEVRADLERAGWRQVGVCGADGPDDFDNGRTYIAALESLTVPSLESSICMFDDALAPAEILHESVQEFGAVSIGMVAANPLCPELTQYVLQLGLVAPLNPGTDFGVTLVGRDGSLIVGTWRERSFRGLSDAPDSLVDDFRQQWTAASDFEPVAVRIALGEERWLVPMTSEAPRSSSPPTGLTIEQAVRIVARVDAETGTARACLRSADGMECGSDGGVLGYPFAVGRWRASAPIRWTVDLPVEVTPLVEQIVEPSLTCAFRDPDGLYGWQFNSLAGRGTAVYVGEQQFLVNGRQAPETAPWGVVSRNDVSLPVIRVAFDERNDLALVELFDPEEETDLGRSAAFGTTGDELIGGKVHLLSYPSGLAERYSLAVLDVVEITERVIRVEPTGIGRHGAPLVDFCSGDLMGMSIGGDDLLRAETVQGALEDMRGRAIRPVFSQDGPPGHGSAAMLGQPLYAGPMQPEFSGKVCDVHPSERYDTHYAVYASSVDNPDVWRVYDKDGDRPKLCDFGDKIFIVEYRADQEPEAVCIESRRPLSPLSNVELELDGPDGIELLLFREFLRSDCPGLSSLEQTRWFSTHYFKLRNTGEHDFEELDIRVYNEADKRFTPRHDDHDFADSDVWGWRVNVKEGKPVKVVVTVR